MLLPAPAAPRPRRARAGLIALAAAIVAAAAGGEAWFRFARPVEFRRPTTHRDGTLWKSIVHRRSETPGLDYEMKPRVHRLVNGMLVETNSRGWRDREPPSDLGPDDPRIVAVGDSFTFGMRVAGEDAWPNALERALGARLGPERRVDVANLGVSGYSTLDEATLLRRELPALRPSLVVVGYYLNDPETEPVQQLHQHFRPARAWEHSALLRGLAWRARLRDQERLGGGDVFRYLHRDPDAWRGVVEGLADVASSASACGARALLVVLPTLRGYERWEDYPYADLHAQAIAAARGAGLDTLDVLPAWTSSGRRPADLRADEEHPNAEGHARIAAAIAAELEARPELLGGPTRPPSTRP